jgi:major membrane immunogen (membrane-anchored lipoprotein)
MSGGIRIMKPILRILTVLITASVLIACGSSAASAPQPQITAGTYRLKELYDDEGTSLNDKLARLEAEGSTVTLILSEDGTGTYQLFDETEAVTWNETSLTLFGETYTMEQTPEALTVHSGSGTEGRMVFVMENN